MAKRRVWSEEEKEWIRENLKYDPETGHLWWTKPRPKVNLDRPAGSYSKSSYIHVETTLVNGKRLQYKAHQLAWFLYYGEDAGLLDHIDNDRTNNKIENLRPATYQANSLNRKPHGRSKYKGVFKAHNRWRARIQVRGLHANLGSFETEEEAAMAFDKKCEEYKRRCPDLAVYFKTNKDLGLL